VPEVQGTVNAVVASFHGHPMRLRGAGAREEKAMTRKGMQNVGAEVTKNDYKKLKELCKSMSLSTIVRVALYKTYKIPADGEKLLNEKRSVAKIKEMEADLKDLLTIVNSDKQ
jgi:hypothetical protein